MEKKSDLVKRFEDAMLDPVAGGYIGPNRVQRAVYTVDGSRIKLYQSADMQDVYFTVENGKVLTFDGEAPQRNDIIARLFGREPEEFYWAMNDGTWLILKKSDIKPLGF